MEEHSRKGKHQSFDGQILIDYKNNQKADQNEVNEAEEICFSLDMLNFRILINQHI